MNSLINQNICSSCAAQQNLTLAENLIGVANTVCPECGRIDNENIVTQSIQKNQVGGTNLICPDCQNSMNKNININDNSVQQITEQQIVEVQSTLCPGCGRMTEE